MLGFGPPVERQARRQWWRRQIQRQQQSHVTVAEFCRRHGIQPVTFYSWKRRFQDEAPAPAASGPMPQPRAKPMTRGVPSADAAFVPVSIVDAGVGGLLEIEFGNACTVRLKGTVDPKLLRVAIRAAGRLGGTTQGGD
ncbi:MAG TPA: transposase [Tepidisphaeraceae bacterium]